MTIGELDRLSARLPAGCRVRAFDDRDRERIVDELNAQVHPMQRQSAAEWRQWERLEPDETLHRISVEDHGGIFAFGQVGSGGVYRQPDGTYYLALSVFRRARRKGIGSALLGALEHEALRRSAPRVLANVNEAIEGSLAWAQERGYRDVGRRIRAYLELAAFDPAPHQAVVERVRADGIALRTFAEELAGKDPAGREGFFRALYDAEGPMYEDVPMGRRPERPPVTTALKVLESGQLVMEASVVAYHGDRIVGFTETGRTMEIKGNTWMTGTARDHRGRGVATALKVEALSRAKAVGLRAMLTTNDEPNKAMRGINAKLGYRPLPAQVQLEKAL